MKTPSTKDLPFHARTSYRLISAAFGLCLVGAGLYVLLDSAATELLRITAGLVLVLAGGNMVLAACRARASWLSKIGPLP